jgi:DNA processing protein
VTDDQRLYWVGFNHVKGIGPVRFQALIDVFGDAQSAWHAPVDALRHTGLNSRIIEELIATRSRLSLEKLWQQIASQDIRVLTWNDSEYPRLLKEIQQPPPVLYLRGCLTPEDECAVSIVGTRRVTPYGRQVAERVARVLAQNGVTVVSGLARGVDSIAHQAALDAGGRTIAVFGCGVEQVYPPEHRRLAEQILQNGALISDYPPGTPPEANNFPPRNRIISGLALAVVVVEAGQTSGALITTRFAADQGREVFAVPGSIFAPACQGTNRLIRDGATPLLQPEDVLEVLNMEQMAAHRAARTVLPADSTEAQILALLSHEPTHVDEIQARCGLPIERVSATLVLMELKGLVQQTGGMNYVREELAAYNVG